MESGKQSHDHGNTITHFAPPCPSAKEGGGQKPPPPKKKNTSASDLISSAVMDLLQVCKLSV